MVIELLQDADPMAMVEIELLKVENKINTKMGCHHSEEDLLQMLVCHNDWGELLTETELDNSRLVDHRCGGS